MNKEEIKFKLREIFNKSLIISRYFIKEPFIESKRLFKGYYNSTLLFWIYIFIYIYLWKRGVGGWKLKIVLITLFVIYVYSFIQSEKWKEYYETEVILQEKIT